MSYTCERCGKEFETPIMIESGGVYGDMPHKEPASPCCEDSFTEIVEEEFYINIMKNQNQVLPKATSINQVRTITHDGIMIVLTCIKTGLRCRTNNLVLQRVLEAKKNRSFEDDCRSIETQLLKQRELKLVRTVNPCN